VALGQEINYESAGTIEFLFDDQSNDFWFLEMNTRLQVEHPVTEMVTGIDIVGEQIKIAQGKELNISQDDIQTEGHSIEARIYAEDPDNNFLPSTGKLIADNHTNKDDIRWDTGVEEGIEIGTDFDPMLAKVIAYGSTRGQAIEKLCRELQSVHFGGFTNNIEFLINILRDKNFIAGKTTTDFIELNQPTGHISLDESELLSIGITASLWLQGLNRYSATVQKHIPPGWHNARLPNQRTLFEMEGEVLEIQYKRQRDGSFMTSNDNKVLIHDWQTNSIDIEIDGFRHQSNISMNDDLLLVQHQQGSKILTILPRFKSSDSKLVKGSLVSPMPGKVIEIKIEQGQVVSRGEELVVIEAMKMNHTISADQDGAVKEIFIKVGDQLDLGESLLTLSKDESE
jgi:propionyl-CoA carboxylase alpha chain